MKKVTQFILKKNPDKSWTLIVYFKNTFETLAPMPLEDTFRIMQKAVDKK